MVHHQLQREADMYGMQKAVATRLKPEDIVSTICIFSDMEFDSATHGGIYSTRLSSRYVVGRREEKSNFQSVKVRTSRWTIAQQNLVASTDGAL